MVHTIIKLFKKIIVCVLEFFYIVTCVIFKIKACGYSEFWSNARYDISFQIPSSRNPARILKENTSTIYHYIYNYFCVCGILCTWMVKFSPGTDRSISKTDWRPIQPCLLVHVDATKFYQYLTIMSFGFYVYFWSFYYKYLIQIDTVQTVVYY